MYCLIVRNTKTLRGKMFIYPRPNRALAVANHIIENLANFSVTVMAQDGAILFDKYNTIAVIDGV